MKKKNENQSSELINETANNEIVPQGAFMMPDNGGFEVVSEIVPFWDFEANKVLVGVFMGEGNNVGEGAKSTKTWKFDVSGSTYLVPQWAMLSDLQGEPAMVYMYRITYHGLYHREDGSKFHQLKVERRKLS